MSERNSSLNAYYQILMVFCPVQSSLREVYGVIDHQNSEKALASVYITATEFCLLPHKEFPSAKAWAPGASVVICCTDFEGRLRPYHAIKTSFQKTEWITRVAGEISVHPKGFAFVNDVFVPPHLAQAYESGQEVTFVAVRKLNKKTNKLGWAAIG